MGIIRLLLTPIRLLWQLIEQTAIKIYTLLLKISLKSYRTFFVSLIGVVGVAFGFYTHYRPDVNVSFSDPLISDNITTSIFTIENNGYSNIYRVIPFYTIEYFSSENKQGAFIELLDVKTLNRPYSYNKIHSKRKQAISFNIFNQNAINMGHPKDYVSVDAALTIQVYYQYWKWYSNIDTFRFKSTELLDGNIIWKNTNENFE